MKRCALAMIALALAAPSCRRGAVKSEPPTFDPSVLNVATSEKGRLRVEVEGATTIHFDETVPLQIFRGGNDPRVPANLRLLSVGLLEHVELPDGNRFRLAFDLLGYTKDGTYTIPPTGGQESTFLPTGIASNAFVEVIEARDGVPQDIYRYDVLTQQCNLRVGRRGREGLLVCPAVRHAQRGDISLRMEWNVPR